MNRSNLSRRMLLKGAGAMSAAAILATYPGARLVGAQGSAEYDLIDFGPFDVEVTSGPLTGRGVVSGINEAGTVCGLIGVEEDRFSPAIWSTTGKLKRLKSGQLGGRAMEINEDGVVVGHAFESVDEVENRRPVVWRNGEPTDLPDFDGATDVARGEATAINNDGVIVGNLRVGNFSQAVRWIDDVAEAFPDSPSGPALSAILVNDNGSVVASIHVDGHSGFVQTFGLWRGDDVSLIEFPEEVTDTLNANPSGLNNLDQVVLSVYDPSGEDPSNSFSFIVDGETTTLIDQRAAGIAFYAQDLNDASIVVGQAFIDEEWRAAMWRESEMIDLNSLIPSDSGLTLTRTAAINNAGMMAAMATDEDGASHGALLIPRS